MRTIATRLAMIVSLALIVSDVGVSPGWSQECGKQNCDLIRTVYENHSASVAAVTIELTDACPDADSYLEVYDHPDPMPGPVAAKGTIPDMSTQTFTFDVRPSGIIKFNCRGKGAGHGSTGSCFWHVVSTSIKP